MNRKHYQTPRGAYSPFSVRYHLTPPDWLRKPRPPATLPLAW